jgi:hypothetical protein
LHQTTPSEKEDTQSRDGDTRWNQPNRDYNICHDKEDNTDNAENTTPEVSDDDDLTTILDLPLAKSNRGDIMDDSKVANDITEMDMMGDLIVMREDVTTINMQELRTDMNKEDIFAKAELPTNNSDLYDRKHVTNKVTRREDMGMEVDTKYVTAFEQPEAHKIACKMDINKTCPGINIENINIMSTGTNKPPGTTTRVTEEAHPAREELPANNKMVAKYECEEEPDVQSSIDMPDVQGTPNMPPQEELPDDDGVITMYEYSHSRNVTTCQTEALDVAKVLARGAEK